MIALVLVAGRMHSVKSILRGFESEASRSSFEAAFEVKCVQPVFDADVAATIIAMQTDLDPTGATSGSLPSDDPLIPLATPLALPSTMAL